MRKIKVNDVQAKIKELVLQANFKLPQPVKKLLGEAYKKASGREKWVLGKILENASIAGREQIPLCQDTGLPIIFLEIGQEINFINGALEKAVWRGVEQGYKEGYLRRSIVIHPLKRDKTDFSPSPIHHRIIPGNKLKLTVLIKGFGSENVSRTKMLNPTSELSNIEDLVVNLVKEKAANACPPLFIGIGIGGSLEEAVLSSKKVLIDRLGKISRDEIINRMEKKILDSVNKSGIGAAAWGGKFTALDVKISCSPTHIAGLPVAISLNCHCLRWAKAEL